MNKISCVIITLNEEKNIQRCLQSVGWCDEIIVVDSGSIDRTVGICKDYNCKVYAKDFNGYGEQKKYAVSLASNDWILSLDADEVVSEELKKEISGIFSGGEIQAKGFIVPRSLIFLGRKFKYGKESREYLLRLFNKNFGNFTEKKVHEGIVVDGEKRKLNGELYHYSYTSIHQYFEKFNQYTTRAAAVLYEKNKKRNIISVLFLFPFYLLKNYVLKGNFLNGSEGLMWAFFSSYYPIVKYSKLWRLNRNKNKKVVPE